MLKTFQITFVTQMDLECWSDDWGIASIDPECLKILAFAKFSGRVNNGLIQMIQNLLSSLGTSI